VWLQGFSSAELSSWLDDLRASVPAATLSAAYWICKARVAAKAARDDFSAALTVLDLAEQHQPQVGFQFTVLYLAEEHQPQVGFQFTVLHLAEQHQPQVGSQLIAM